MVFCNIITATEKKLKQTVTILILIDGFLQYVLDDKMLSDINKSQSLF